MRRLVMSLVIFWGLLQGARAQDVLPEVLSVWVSEAAVAMYTLDPSNLETQQSALSRYFSSQGWIDFNKARAQSGILKAIETHHYTVRAIPMRPPKIMALDNDHWEATLVLLVSYTNPEYEQQQVLKLTLRFLRDKQTPSVRNFAIEAVTSREVSDLCACRPSKLPKGEN